MMVEEAARCCGRIPIPVLMRVGGGDGTGNDARDDAGPRAGA